MPDLSDSKANSLYSITRILQSTFVRILNNHDNVHSTFTYRNFTFKFQMEMSPNCNFEIDEIARKNNPMKFKKAITILLLSILWNE
jgi:hypothetical protein